MSSLTKYEDAAQAFREAYPIGTTVRGDQIVTWAHDHANGLASDLLIDDTGKKLSALRRHLNSGAASRNFAEEDRYVLDVTDAKRKVFVVRSLAEYVNQKAEAAFGKSVSGALSPLKQSQKALDDIKLEELDETERGALEARMQEIVNAMTPLRKTLNEQVVERWEKRLITNGYTAEQARTLVELLPQLQREIKLIRATS